MTKIKAFLIHLSISAAVVGAFLAVTFFVWYPAPYFEIDGTLAIIGLLAMVDVFLGPILTLVVYKPGKPSLKFDLSVIVALQLAAFVYGAHVIFTERPGYIVHVVEMFLVVPASTVDMSQSNHPELQVGLFSGPNLVYLRYREEDEPIEKVFAKILSGSDITIRPELYEPYQNHVDAVLAAAGSISTLMADATEDGKADLQQWMDERGYAAGDLRYAYLKGKNKTMVMLLDAETGMPLGAID